VLAHTECSWALLGTQACSPVSSRPGCVFLYVVPPGCGKSGGNCPVPSPAPDLPCC
jgi:hypothetical protein